MSGGLRTSVKGHLFAQRLTLALDPLLENETTNNNVTAPLLDVPPHAVEEITMDSTTYGLGICDGNIPCFPMFNAAKNMASDRTRTGADSRPPQGVNLNSNIPSVSVPSSSQTEGEILPSFNLKSFHFNELDKATRFWRTSQILGNRLSGSVFEGWIEGKAIAVKIVSRDRTSQSEEWMKEVNCLGQLSHPNLVKLIGYCLEDDRRLLVYEFMPKGSLERGLFQRGVSFALPWDLRMKIALGAAKGLAFLHSDKANVIFVDFKTSKVLLDSNYNVKLCGYGPAKEQLGFYRPRRIIVDECGEADDWALDPYTAPEFRYNGTDSLTSKSDVYSFGILLLEILSGRRAYDMNTFTVTGLPVPSDLLELASNRRKVYQIIDSRLEAITRVKLFLNLATECLSKEPTLRPDMNQVIEKLEKLQSR